jgi:hypothetical protein
VIFFRSIPNSLKTMSKNKLGKCYQLSFFPSTTLACDLFIWHDAFFLEQKCKTYSQIRLRAPPKALVFQWGKTLRMAKEDIQTVYDTLPLRHQLGRCPPPPFNPKQKEISFFSTGQRCSEQYQILEKNNPCVLSQSLYGSGRYWIFCTAQKNIRCVFLCRSNLYPKNICFAS